MMRRHLLTCIESLELVISLRKMKWIWNWKDQKLFQKGYLNWLEDAVVHYFGENDDTIYKNRSFMDVALKSIGPRVGPGWLFFINK